MYLSFVVCVLFTLSHRQAAVEGGFSLGNNLLENNMTSETIVSRRLIKDCLVSNKLVPCKVEICKNLMPAVTNARNVSGVESAAKKAKFKFKEGLD